MSSPLLAVAWDDLIKVVPIVVAVLFWVISHFAGQVPQKPPQRGRAPGQPAPPEGQPPAAEPLQAEIDEFLRQAQAMREDKPPRQVESGPARRETPGQSTRPEEAPPRRRPTGAPQKRSARRDPSKPASRPTPPPVVVEVREQQPTRETVGQHVAHNLDSSKFSQRATQLSQVRQESDAEFQQHMQRVFQHELVSLKPVAAGIFEAAAASAAATSAAATAKETAAAAGSQSSTAPQASRKASSDIALFLAGRKNIRDAIILNEILPRPEHRW